MARVARLGFIPPQLPSLTDQPPERADWIHEVKHDGYRTMLLVERGAACAHTRNGHNWSDRYPGIIAAARKLSCRSAILDGEVIVQDARGVSSFRPPPGRTQGETLGIGQARPGKSNSVQRRVHWRCCRILSRLCRT